MLNELTKQFVTLVLGVLLFLGGAGVGTVGTAYVAKSYVEKAYLTGYQDATVSSSIQILK